MGISVLKREDEEQKNKEKERLQTAEKCGRLAGAPTLKFFPLPKEDQNG
jgi:hypothetical protein